MRQPTRVRSQPATRLANARGYLTMPEVAERLGISRVTLYRLMDSDPTFRTFRVGRQRRMRPDALEEWVAQQELPTNPKHA